MGKRGGRDWRCRLAKRTKQKKSECESSSDILDSVLTNTTSTLMNCVVGHNDVFFNVFIKMLSANDMANFCDAISATKLGHAVLYDSTHWDRLIQELVMSSGSIQPKRSRRTSQKVIYVNTILYPNACQQVETYLSLYDQYRVYKDLVIVLSGDLETITHVHAQPIDCLAFPTASTFNNPHTGVAGCVHRRAGTELETYVRKTWQSHRRDSKLLITPGFASGMNRLIHCTGPAFNVPQRDVQLYSAYVEAMISIAELNDVHCAAFASISTGNMRYPVDEAALMAMSAVRDVIRSRKWTKTIAFVCIDQTVLDAFQQAYKRICDCEFFVEPFR